MIATQPDNPFKPKPLRGVAQPQASATRRDSRVAWVFDQPALVYFPVRVAAGCVIGRWSLAAAKGMEGGRPRPMGGARAAA